jgi:hypothetical protein
MIGESSPVCLDADSAAQRAMWARHSLKSAEKRVQLCRIIGAAN